LFSLPLSGYLSPTGFFFFHLQREVFSVGCCVIPFVAGGRQGNVTFIRPVSTDFFLPLYASNPMTFDSFWTDLILGSLFVLRDLGVDGVVFVNFVPFSFLHDFVSDQVWSAKCTRLPRSFFDPGRMVVLLGSSLEGSADAIVSRIP